MRSIEVIRPKFGEKERTVTDRWQVEKALKEEGSKMTVGRGTKEISIDLIKFRPGERTEEHQHSYGQLLQVIGGEGIIGQKEGRSWRIAQDDVVLIPPDVCHWHGTESGAKRV